MSNEGKEIILMRDFNRNLFPANCDRDWVKFMFSLGLSQLICQPTRITNDSRTLIDHIYTNREDNISSVSVCRLTISDHYAIFGIRKLNISERKNSHQTISYRSFKHFDTGAFRQVPWGIIENFNDVNEIVQV